jgi:hypothetical protein
LEISHLGFGFKFEKSKIDQNQDFEQEFEFCDWKKLILLHCLYAFSLSLCTLYFTLPLTFTLCPTLYLSLGLSLSLLRCLYLFSIIILSLSTLIYSLSLSQTHTHTHTHTLFFTCSLCVTLTSLLVIL